MKITLKGTGQANFLDFGPFGTDYFLKMMLLKYFSRTSTKHCYCSLNCKLHSTVEMDSVTCFNNYFK